MALASVLEPASAQGLEPVSALVLELASALVLAPVSALVLYLESRHRSSYDSSPACNQGWPHILQQKTNIRNSDCHRCTASALVLEVTSAQGWAPVSALALVLELGSATRKHTRRPHIRRLGCKEHSHNGRQHTASHPRG